MEHPKEVLKAKSPIFETHTHLDYIKSKDELESVLQKSKEANVTKLITISVDGDNLDTVLNLAQTHENVYCSQGIHPHAASSYTHRIEEKINENAKNKKVLAIGEIGLDYHYNHAPQEIQRATFEKQLDLAIKLNLPVIVHTREAEDDTISILKNVKNHLKKGLVIHCFSSNKKLADFAIQTGFYFGLGGVITFKNAHAIRAIVKTIPLSQILLETDAPYLTPHPFRGQENFSYYLPYVVSHLCQILEKDEEEVLPCLFENTKRLFF